MPHAPTAWPPRCALPTQGIDWETLYSFTARTLPGVRYNPQNFFVLDLKADGTFALTDWTKNRNGSRCSDYWTYSGSAAYKNVAGKDPGARSTSL